MLKSKVVFVLVFFSLFFTISHDLVLAKHFDNDCSVTLEVHELIEDCECCNDLMDLHETFHFSAIIYDLLDMNSPHTFYTKLNFTTLTLPLSISKSNFRPPIA